MKEKTIKNKAYRTLEAQGFHCWSPVKSRWGGEKDIWGVFDMVAGKEAEILYVQYTTAPNVLARVRKVKDFLSRTGIVFTGNNRAEVWGRKPNGEWRVVVL